MSERPGRLSSLDLVPEAGREDVMWALDELNRRERTQADILEELNGRLADKGLALISKSAFSRRAVRIYAQQKRDADARAMYVALEPQITPASVSQGTLVLSELIKTLISELLDLRAGVIDAKGALELARALKTIIESQALSLELKNRMVADMEAKVTATLDAVAKTRGLSRDVVSDIRAQILGVTSS